MIRKFLYRGTFPTSFRALMIIIGLISVFGLSASAAPITGDLNIVGSVRISNATVDWAPPAGPPFTTGVFVTVLPGTLYFANIVNANPLTPYGGNVVDLTGGPYAGPVNLPFFMNSFTAPSYGGLHFDLTELVAATAGVCVGGEAIDVPCRLGALSPFTLLQKANGVAVDFQVRGFFQDDNVAISRAFYKGLYTTQLTDQALDTIAEVLTRIDASAPNNFFAAAYSANFAEATISMPEPGTVFLTLAGSLLMLGSVALRKYRK